MFPEGKGGWCIELTTLPPSCAECLEIWEPQPHLISLLYSIVSYRYGTSQQPHATYKTYKTFDSHTLTL